MLAAKLLRSEYDRQDVVGRKQTISDMRWCICELRRECESTSPSMCKIRRLVNANPGAVKAANENGLPLHAVCLSFINREYSLDRIQCSLNIIQFLVEKWPESVKATNRYWNLPLHQACQRSVSREVIQYLVEKWPESVKATNKYGNLPLHEACQRKVSREVIQYLVEQWPESVKATNRDGNLPVHEACTQGAPLAVIQCLVEQWPESVKATGQHQGLPLHQVCSNKVSLDVVQYMVKQWPEAVKYRNSDGETPLGVAARQLHANIDVINWLQLPWRDVFN